MIVYNTEKAQYIFFLKSGHNLLKSIFRTLFFNHKIAFNNSIDDGKFKRKQKFIFVRNPINRFFSGYYYLNINEEIKLNEYIKDYDKIYTEKNNAHLVPQLCNFCVDKNIEECFNSKLKEYKIVRIEDIDEKVENFKKNKLEDENLYDQEISFDFLDSKNKLMNVNFVLLYFFFKNYYEKGHHKNRDFVKEITRDQYIRVYSLFEDEMLFYGYEKHDLTNCKKKMI